MNNYYTYTCDKSKENDYLSHIKNNYGPYAELARTNAGDATIVALSHVTATATYLGFLLLVPDGTVGVH